MKDCQESEELRSRCREKNDRAGQAKLDELFMKEQRNPQTLCQLLAQIRLLKEKANSVSDAKEFSSS